MRDDHLRLSDTERDTAAATLAEHYAQGRLTPEEHAERLDRIWAARTRGELLPVFRDLPGAYAGRSVPGRRFPAYAAQPAAVQRPRRSGLRALPAPVLVLIGVLLVFTVLTHLPLILIGLLVWFFVMRTQRGHYPRRW
jgi:hypothetical protein